MRFLTLCYLEKFAILVYVWLFLTYIIMAWLTNHVFDKYFDTAQQFK